eukprot:4622537-Prymnesium_polylepis.1
MNAAADDHERSTGATPSVGSGTRSDVAAKYAFHTPKGSSAASVTFEPPAWVALAAAAAVAPLSARRWRSNAATSNDLVN